MKQAPIRLVQFTDLHLYGDPAGQLRGVATLPALESALAAARTRLASCDAVLLTGDLVQDDPGGYAHVRRLFADSPAPVYCLPGNHDQVEAMQVALAATPFQICGSAVFGRWLLVLLDSYCHGTASGRMTAAELARLEAVLAAHPDHHALVCLHHHPVPSGSRWLDHVGLSNPDALFATLDRHPQVRGLVWGHVHQLHDTLRNGVRLLGTPATSAQFKPASDDFQVDDLPPGYRWLELHADGRIETAACWLDPPPTPSA
ncbi:MAG: metallophosphoesterase [Pseudomonadota bacterium]